MSKYETLVTRRGITNAVKIIPDANTNSKDVGTFVYNQLQTRGRALLIVNLSPKTGGLVTPLNKECHLITAYHFEEIKTLPVESQERVCEVIGEKISKSDCTIIFNSRD